MKQVVVVVDTQGDFIRPDGALSVSGADALVAPMQAQLRALKPDETEAVIFTFDTHDPQTYPGSAEAEQFPPHCYRETEGWRNMLSPDVIDPAIPAFALEKGVFAMWAEPGLTLTPMQREGEPRDRDGFFAELRARGVEEALVFGVAADYCVRWAVAGLLERGFSCTVPTALTRGIERDIETIASDEFDGQLRVSQAVAA